MIFWEIIFLKTRFCEVLTLKSYKLQMANFSRKLMSASRKVNRIVNRIVEVCLLGN